MNEVEVQETVAWLRTLPQAHCEANFTARVMAKVSAQETRRRRVWWASIAAAVAVCVGVAWQMALRPASLPQVPNVAAASCPASSVQAYHRAYSVVQMDAPQRAATVAAIMHEQRADGSWANMHLTRRNLAALEYAAAHGVASAMPAVRRARRFLRLSGSLPITDAQFTAEARDS